MDNSLFARYQKLLEKDKEVKEECLELLKSIFPHKAFDLKQIVIENKVVTLHLSSSERTVFIVRKGHQLFKEKQFIVHFS